MTMSSNVQFTLYGERKKLNCHVLPIQYITLPNQGVWNENIESKKTYNHATPDDCKLK